MLGANVFFKTGFRSKRSSACATAVPCGDTGTRLDIKVAADELFLFGVNGALMD